MPPKPPPPPPDDAAPLLPPPALRQLRPVKVEVVRVRSRLTGEAFTFRCHAAAERVRMRLAGTTAHDDAALDGTPSLATARAADAAAAAQGGRSDGYDDDLPRPRSRAPPARMSAYFEW